MAPIVGGLQIYTLSPCKIFLLTDGANRETGWACTCFHPIKYSG